MAVVGDSVSDETGKTRADGGAQPGVSRWTPRLLLLGPALMQLAVAYLLSQDLRGGVNGAAVLVPVILLALGGAGGIVIGAFGRSRMALRIGILCALLGFALPAAIHGAATPVDHHTSTIHGLGDFDAEGLGALMFYRMLVELPFWGLYAVIAIAGYVPLTTPGRTLCLPALAYPPGTGLEVGAPTLRQRLHLHSATE